MVVTVTLNPCVDRLIYINKLAAHDANRIIRVEEDAGGKGVNAARVLNRLGVPTVATGFLGGQPGRYVEHLLVREGVKCSFVFVDGNTRTNFAIQESDDTPPTTLNEPGPAISNSHISELLTKFEQVASKVKFISLGGSLPPGVPADIYATMIKIAHGLRVKVVLDADLAALQAGVQARPFLIKPNEFEIERLLGRQVRTLKQAADAARDVRAMGIDVVIVSLGAKGAAAACEEGVFSGASPRIKAISTVGSGDSMIAGVLSILCQNGEMEEALRWGIAAGAATAMTDGTDIGTAAQTRGLVPLVKIKRHS